MKIRNGFVSNSSSASFIISKKDLTENQKDELLKYTDNEKNYDGWSIRESEFFINGSTVMNNGIIKDYLNKLYINPKIISWEHEG